MLIINQIDKHHEEEISFEDFKTAINDNIERWHLKIEHILYTSIYDSVNNEIDNVIPLMEHFAHNAETNKAYYFERMIAYIESTQIHYLNKIKTNLLATINVEEDEVDMAYQKASANVAMNAEQAILADANNAQLLLNGVKDIIKMLI